MEWRFWKPLQQYDSRKLYTLLHQRHSLSPVLSARWVSSDLEVRWICQLHIAWYLHLSYKLWVFACWVVYQGLPSKVRFAKKRVVGWVIYGTVALLDNAGGWCRTVTQFCFMDSFIGVQSFLGTWGTWSCSTSWEFETAMFAIWKLQCKYVFSDEVSFVQNKFHSWREEVCMQLSAKGYLLIKDTKEFSAVPYSEFIAALVALRKRIWFHIVYTLPFFFLVLSFSATM